ncbi:MAG: hypothetical protein AAB271_09430, partial [Nitrospirota bacterium]
AGRRSHVPTDSAHAPRLIPALFQALARHRDVPRIHRITSRPISRPDDFPLFSHTFLPPIPPYTCFLKTQIA